MNTEVPEQQIQYLKSYLIIESNQFSLGYLTCLTELYEESKLSNWYMNTTLIQSELKEDLQKQLNSGTFAPSSPEPVNNEGEGNL